MWVRERIKDLEQRRVEVRAHELGEEAVAEHLKPTERHIRRDGECVAGGRLVLLTVHHGDEAIGRRLRANVRAREVAAQQVLDEGCLTHRVLAEEQHHRLGVKVSILGG